ncbi:hypothetical protein Trydic_g23056 [Trypoxylus dichotomus]
MRLSWEEDTCSTARASAAIFGSVSPVSVLPSLRSSRLAISLTRPSACFSWKRDKRLPTINKPPPPTTANRQRPVSTSRYHRAGSADITDDGCVAGHMADFSTKNRRTCGIFTAISAGL